MAKVIVHRESFTVSLTPDPDVIQRLIHFKEEVDALRTFVAKEGDECFVAMTPSAYARIHSIPNLPDFMKLERGEGDIIGTFDDMSMRSGFYQKVDEINWYDLPGYGIGFLIRREA